MPVPEVPAASPGPAAAPGAPRHWPQGGSSSPVGRYRGALPLQRALTEKDERGCQPRGRCQPGHSGPGPPGPPVCPREWIPAGTAREGTDPVPNCIGSVPEDTKGVPRVPAGKIRGGTGGHRGRYRSRTEGYRDGTGGYWGGTGVAPKGTGKFWVPSAHPSASRGPGPALHGLSSSFQPAGAVPGAGARQQPPLFPSPRPGAPRGTGRRRDPASLPPHPGTEREETGGTGAAEHRRYRLRWASGIAAPGVRGDRRGERHRGGTGNGGTEDTDTEGAPGITVPEILALRGQREWGHQGTVNDGTPGIPTPRGHRGRGLK